MAIFNPTTPDLDFDLDRLAHEGVIKLEITGGVPTWEAFPGVRHQVVVDLIRASIAPAPHNVSNCACAHYSDIYIRFKDGSLKRPDISIFCTQLPLTDEAVEIIPESVIEVISPGYEYKDLELNPPFYIAQGVNDLVVVDPRTGAVTHYHAGRAFSLKAPVTVKLQSGCRCVIPEVGEPAE